MALVNGRSAHADAVTLAACAWVDVARPFPYRIEGGSNEFAASGEICDLMKSFVLEGASVEVKFIPKSTRKRRYTYAGKVDGAEVYRLRPMRGACRG